MKATRPMKSILQLFDRAALRAEYQRALADVYAEHGEVAHHPIVRKHATEKFWALMERTMISPQNAGRTAQLKQEVYLTAKHKILSEMATLAKAVGGD